MNHINMEHLLDCIMDIGEQMLISGAEVHRAEDSLQRIFTAYGTKRTDVFIITSSMVVTIHTTDGKVFTQTRRITETAADYEKLHRLNELSRSICQSRCAPSEIRRQLDEINAGKTCQLWQEFICYAVIAAIFTMFFGGGIAETLTGFVIGALIRLMLLVCDRTVHNKIFAKFMSSMMATALAALAMHAGLIPTVDNVIIGNIMTMIPGIGLTNALKDLFVGDSIAGLLRTIEACITALAIAAGYFAVVFLAGGSIA